MPQTKVPKVDAPIEEHKRYAEEFLKEEKHKKPKPNQDTKSDEAKP